MCFSILKVTGVYDRYRKTEEAKLNKKQPLSAAAVNDPLEKLAREIELERRTYDKLKGNLPVFIAMYSAAPGSLRMTSSQPQIRLFSRPMAGRSIAGSRLPAAIYRSG